MVTIEFCLTTFSTSVGEPFCQPSANGLLRKKNKFTCEAVTSFIIIFFSSKPVIKIMPYAQTFGYNLSMSVYVFVFVYSLRFDKNTKPGQFFVILLMFSHSHFLYKLFVKSLKTSLYFCRFEIIWKDNVHT